MKLLRNDYIVIAGVATIVIMRIVWELSELAYTAGMGLGKMIPTDSYITLKYVIWVPSMLLSLACIGIGLAIVVSKKEIIPTTFPFLLHQPQFYVIMAIILNVIATLVLFS